LSFVEDITFILFTNSLVNKLYAFSISYFATEVSLGSLDQLFLPSNHPKMLNVKIPTDKSFLLKLANGLDFIHSKNLVHGDIRPENVLVFSSSNSKTVSFKWTGFGLFKSVDEHGRYRMSQVKGNLKWMAPEMFQHLWRYGAHEHIPVTMMLKESDVFPAGCVFFFYLTGGLHPFGYGSDIVSNIRNWDRVNAMGNFHF
jgi:serine/threonine protein kinase